MRASGDDELTHAMSLRPDISRRLFKRLMTYATEKARQRMLASSPPADREAVNRVLTQIAAQAGSRTISRKEHEAAQRMVHSFSQDTEQTRAKVLQFADGYRIAELVAALSILSGTPIALVSRLICDTEPFGAMVMCKAIGLDWMVAHAVLNNLPGISEDREEKLGEMEEHYAHMSTGIGRAPPRLLANTTGAAASAAILKFTVVVSSPKRTRPPAGEPPEAAALTPSSLARRKTARELKLNLPRPMPGLDPGTHMTQQGRRNTPTKRTRRSPDPPSLGRAWRQARPCPRKGARVGTHATRTAAGPASAVGRTGLAGCR